MLNNTKYFSIMRQYAQLENVNNRDYSEQLAAIGNRQVEALVADGMPSDEALAWVNQTFTNQQLRFPLQLPWSPPGEGFVSGNGRPFGELAQNGE